MIIGAKWNWELTKAEIQIDQNSEDRAMQITSVNSTSGDWGSDDEAEYLFK